MEMTRFFRSIGLTNASHIGSRVHASRHDNRIAERKRRQYQFRFSSALSACLFAIIPCCKSDNPDPQVSSETNFLQHCDGLCADGLKCLCGVCTKACTGTSECTEFAAAARCEAVLSQPDTGSLNSCERGATCDLTCTGTVDCAALGSNYRCESGYCRKGNVVCPSLVLPPGDQNREIVVGAVTRAYTMHVPPNYAGNTPVPLVLDFHPMGLGLAWEQANSGFGSLSDQAGFIVVWPKGLEDSWNIGPCCTTSKTIDDYAFARAIVRQLSTEACIDTHRVFAVGFAIGGAMAYYLGCTQAEVFAAIASSSMDLAVDSAITCQPSRAIAEISFRGATDTVVPYAGGTTNPPGHPEMAFDVLGAVGTFEKWARLNQCTGSSSAENANGCSTYSTCQDGTQVSLCTIQGGGQVVGDATIAWEFLKAHPMP